MKSRIALKIISLFLIGVFCFREISYAAPVELGAIHELPLQAILHDPSKFEAPSNLSALKEIHKGSNGRLIVLVQDAHSNLSGQENLAKTLDDITKKYFSGTSLLVLSEGGAGDCSLTSLKKIAPPVFWKKIARSYLLQGKIAGEEYFNLTSGHPMKIIGLEDISLYVKSVQNYAQLAGQRESTLAYLKKVRASAAKVKKKLYPQELLDYEKIKGEGPEKNFEAALKGLINLSAKSALALTDYPNLQKLKLLQDKEKEIDFNLANLEQAALIEQIAKSDSAKELEDVVKEMRVAQNSKAAQFSYFQNISRLANEKNLSLEKYPNFTRYGEYLAGFSDIDLDRVLNEMEKLEDQVYVKYLNNTLSSPQSLSGDHAFDPRLEISGVTKGRDALLLRSIDRYLKLLDTAYRIQMTTKDFNMFKANEPDFATAAYLAFINRKLMEFGFFTDLIAYTGLLEESKNSLEAFYDSVDRRDLAFLNTAERALKEEKQNVAILISGGYHTPHLKKLFMEKGYSIVVLTPMVTEATNQAKYEKVLLAPIKGETRKVESIQGETKDQKSLSALDKDLLPGKNKREGIRASLFLPNIEEMTFLFVSGQDNLAPEQRLVIIDFYLAMANKFISELEALGGDSVVDESQISKWIKRYQEARDALKVLKASGLPANAKVNTATGARVTFVPLSKDAVEHQVAAVVENYGSEGLVAFRYFDNDKGQLQMTGPYSVGKIAVRGTNEVIIVSEITESGRISGVHFQRGYRPIIKVLAPMLVSDVKTQVDELATKDSSVAFRFFDEEGQLKQTPTYRAAEVTVTRNAEGGIGILDGQQGGIYFYASFKPLVEVIGGARTAIGDFLNELETAIQEKIPDKKDGLRGIVESAGALIKQDLNDNKLESAEKRLQALTERLVRAIDRKEHEELKAFLTEKVKLADELLTQLEQPETKNTSPAVASSTLKSPDASEIAHAAEFILNILVNQDITLAVWNQRDAVRNKARRAFYEAFDTAQKDYQWLDLNSNGSEIEVAVSRLFEEYTEKQREERLRISKERVQEDHVRAKNIIPERIDKRVLENVLNVPAVTEATAPPVEAPVLKSPDASEIAYAAKSIFNILLSRHITLDSWNQRKPDFNNEAQIAFMTAFEIVSKNSAGLDLVSKTSEIESAVNDLFQQSDKKGIRPEIVKELVRPNASEKLDEKALEKALKVPTVSKPSSPLKKTIMGLFVGGAVAAAIVWGLSAFGAGLMTTLFVAAPVFAVIFGLIYLTLHDKVPQGNLSAGLPQGMTQTAGARTAIAQEIGAFVNELETMITTNITDPQDWLRHDVSIWTGKIKDDLKSDLEEPDTRQQVIIHLDIIRGRLLMDVESNKYPELNELLKENAERAGLLIEQLASQQTSESDLEAARPTITPQPVLETPRSFSPTPRDVSEAAAEIFNRMRAAGIEPFNRKTFNDSWNANEPKTRLGKFLSRKTDTTLREAYWEAAREVFDNYLSRGVSFASDVENEEGRSGYNAVANEVIRLSEQALAAEKASKKTTTKTTTPASEIQPAPPATTPTVASQAPVLESIASFVSRLTNFINGLPESNADLKKAIEVRLVALNKAIQDDDTVSIWLTLNELGKGRIRPPKKILMKIFNLLGKRDPIQNQFLSLVSEARFLKDRITLASAVSFKRDESNRKFFKTQQLEDVPDPDIRDTIFLSMILALRTEKVTADEWNSFVTGGSSSSDQSKIKNVLEEFEQDLTDKGREVYNEQNYRKTIQLDIYNKLKAIEKSEEEAKKEREAQGASTNTATETSAETSAPTTQPALSTLPAPPTATPTTSEAAKLVSQTETSPTSTKQKASKNTAPAANTTVAATSAAKEVVKKEIAPAETLMIEATGAKRQIAKLVVGTVFGAIVALALIKFFAAGLIVTGIVSAVLFFVGYILFKYNVPKNEKAHFIPKLIGGSLLGGITAFVALTFLAPATVTAVLLTVIAFGVGYIYTPSTVPNQAAPPQTTESGIVTTLQTFAGARTAKLGIAASGILSVLLALFSGVSATSPVISTTPTITVQARQALPQGFSPIDSYNEAQRAAFILDYVKGDFLKKPGSVLYSFFQNLKSFRARDGSTADFSIGKNEILSHKGEGDIHRTRPDQRPLTGTYTVDKSVIAGINKQDELIIIYENKIVVIDRQANERTISLSPISTQKPVSDFMTHEQIDERINQLAAKYPKSMRPWLGMDVSKEGATLLVSFPGQAFYAVEFFKNVTHFTLYKTKDGPFEFYVRYFDSQNSSPQYARIKLTAGGQGVKDPIREKDLPSEMKKEFGVGARTAFSRHDFGELLPMEDDSKEQDRVKTRSDIGNLLSKAEIAWNSKMMHANIKEAATLLSALSLGNEKDSNRLRNIRQEIEAIEERKAVLGFKKPLFLYGSQMRGHITGLKKILENAGSRTAAIVKPPVSPSKGAVRFVKSLLIGLSFGGVAAGIGWGIAAFFGAKILVTVLAVAIPFVLLFYIGYALFPPKDEIQTPVTAPASVTQPQPIAETQPVPVANVAPQAELNEPAKFIEEKAKILLGLFQAKKISKEDLINFRNNKYKASEPVDADILEIFNEFQKTQLSGNVNLWEKILDRVERLYETEAKLSQIQQSLQIALTQGGVKQDAPLFTEADIPVILSRIESGELKQGEIVDIVTDEDQVIGQIGRDIAHAYGIRHRTANIMIMTPDGKFILQVRSPNKKVYPEGLVGYGGHILKGETYEQATKDELVQELGFEEGHVLEGRFISLGQNGSFKSPDWDNANLENRSWVVYVATPEELVKMRRIASELETEKAKHTRDGFKSWLADRAKEKAGYGEVFGVVELSLDQILEINNQGFVDIEHTFTGGVKEVIRHEPTADALGPLLKDPKVVEALRQAAGARVTEVVPSGDISVENLRGNVLWVHNNSEDKTFSVAQLAERAGIATPTRFMMGQGEYDYNKNSQKLVYPDRGVVFLNVVGAGARVTIAETVNALKTESARAREAAKLILARGDAEQILSKLQLYWLNRIANGTPLKTETRREAFWRTVKMYDDGQHATWTAVQYDELLEKARNIAQATDLTQVLSPTSIRRLNGLILTDVIERTPRHRGALHNLELNRLKKIVDEYDKKKTPEAAGARVTAESEIIRTVVDYRIYYQGFPYRGATILTIEETLKHLEGIEAEQVSIQAYPQPNGILYWENSERQIVKRRILAGEILGMKFVETPDRIYLVLNPFSRGFLPEGANVLTAREAMNKVRESTTDSILVHKNLNSDLNTEGLTRGNAIEAIGESRVLAIELSNKTIQFVENPRVGARVPGVLPQNNQNKKYTAQELRTVLVSLFVDRARVSVDYLTGTDATGRSTANGTIEQVKESSFIVQTESTKKEINFTEVANVADATSFAKLFSTLIETKLTVSISYLDNNAKQSERKLNHVSEILTAENVLDYGLKINDQLIDFKDIANVSFTVPDKNETSLDVYARREGIARLVDATVNYLKNRQTSTSAAARVATTPGSEEVVNGARLRALAVSPEITTRFRGLPDSALFVDINGDTATPNEATAVLLARVAGARLVKDFLKPAQAAEISPDIQVTLARAILRNKSYRLIKGNEPIEIPIAERGSQNSGARLTGVIAFLRLTPIRGENQKITGGQVKFLFPKVLGSDSEVQPVVVRLTNEAFEQALTIDQNEQSKHTEQQLDAIRTKLEDSVILDRVAFSTRAISLIRSIQLETTAFQRQGPDGVIVTPEDQALDRVIAIPHPANRKVEQAIRDEFEPLLRLLPKLHVVFTSNSIFIKKEEGVEKATLALDTTDLLPKGEYILNVMANPGEVDVEAIRKQAESLKVQVGFTPMPKPKLEGNAISMGPNTVAALIVNFLAGIKPTPENIRFLVQNDKYQQLLRIVLGPRYAELKPLDIELLTEAMIQLNPNHTQKFLEGVTFVLLRPIEFDQILSAARLATRTLGTAA